jgi:hypothetical protein
VGQHKVDYSGSIDIADGMIIMTGTWFISADYTDDMELRFPLEEKPGHVMLSYQWNSQPMVKKVAEYLKKEDIPVWFDIDGDMKGNINQAMAEGVEQAALICSFHTPAYAKSVNCTKELNYAHQLKRAIVPVNIDGAMEYAGTWLENIVKDKEVFLLMDPDKDNHEDQFTAGLSVLARNIKEALAEHNRKKEEAKNIPKPPDLYQLGTAVFVMSLPNGADMPLRVQNLSMRRGGVSGWGFLPTAESFHVFGSYDFEGKLEFTREDQNGGEFECVGTYKKTGPNEFEAIGLWKRKDDETQCGSFSIQSPQEG